jgi:succinate dehydrogenase / fumarate reductase cytochrome b subunit
MSDYWRGLSSTVGTKFLVALTGALLVAFVIGHMLGNLQIYLGPEAINSYAVFLKSKPGLLWGARLGLLAAVIIHIWGISRLSLRNQEARPESYALKRAVASSFSSRTMLLSGAVLLAFIVYHLLHFTIGATSPQQFRLIDELGRHDVYSMTILGFQQPLVAISYILAMGILGLHLAHGVASIFHSMGWSRPKTAPLIDLTGRLVALLLVIGNISIPISALLGWIQPTQGAL